MKNFFSKFLKKNDEKELPANYFLVLSHLDEQELNISKKEDELGIKIRGNNILYDCAYICFAYGIIDYLSKYNEDAFWSEAKEYTNQTNLEDGKIAMLSDVFKTWYQNERALTDKEGNFIFNQENNEHIYDKKDLIEIFEWFCKAKDEHNTNVQLVILRGYDFASKIKEQTKNNIEIVNFDLFELMQEILMPELSKTKPFWTRGDFTCSDYLIEKIFGRMCIFDEEYFSSQLNNDALVSLSKKNPESLKEITLTILQFGFHELIDASRDYSWRNHTTTFNPILNGKNDETVAAIIIPLVYGCFEGVREIFTAYKSVNNEIISDWLEEACIFILRMRSNYSIKDEKLKKMYDKYLEEFKSFPEEFLDKEGNFSHLSYFFISRAKSSFINLNKKFSEPGFNLGFYNAFIEIEKHNKKLSKIIK